MPENWGTHVKKRVVVGNDQRNEVSFGTLCAELRRAATFHVPGH